MKEKIEFPSLYKQGEGRFMLGGEQQLPDTANFYVKWIEKGEDLSNEEIEWLVKRYNYQRLRLDRIESNIRQLITQIMI